jgi:hypothetical protein
LCCRFRGQGCGCGIRNGDYGYPTLDQIGEHRWNLIITSLQPAVFDRQIPTLDIAGFRQTAPKVGERLDRGVGRHAAKITDHRYCRLLRARRPRPGGHASAHQCNELASPHGYPLGAGSLSYHIGGRVLCVTANQPPDDRYGSKSTEFPCSRQVRLYPDSDRLADLCVRQLSANATNGDLDLRSSRPNLWTWLMVLALKTLDQSSLDQHAIEAAGLGAIGTAIEQLPAAHENFFLLGKSGIERHAGCFLNH